MNHFVLPRGPQGQGAKARYGDAAIDTIIQSMAKRGSEPRSLHAQVFGGASVVEHLTCSGGNVGQRNVELARSRLAEHGIVIVHQGVGGNLVRKIHFDTANGHVKVKKLPASNSPPYHRGKIREGSNRQMRVLTVDDSPTVLAIYKKIIEIDPQFKLIGQAHDAYQAREMIVSLHPDVIVMDIIMPKISGLNFLRKLMKYYPKPVIIVSTIAKVGSKTQKMAISAGACDVIDKESLSIYGGLEKARNILLPRLKAACIIPVGAGHLRTPQSPF